MNHQSLNSTAWVVGRSHQSRYPLNAWTVLRGLLV